MSAITRLQRPAITIIAMTAVLGACGADPTDGAVPIQGAPVETASMSDPSTTAEYNDVVRATPVTTESRTNISEPAGTDPCSAPSELARQYLGVPDPEESPLSHGVYQAVPEEEIAALANSTTERDLQLSLAYAAIGGCTETVLQLLSLGAFATSDDSMPPIYAASVAGNPEAVSSLLANGATPNVLWGPELWSPLHEAASRGHVEVMELLIVNGADLNVASTLAETPLFRASVADCTACVVVLDNAGAAPDTRALHIAIDNGASAETIRALLELGISPTAPHPGSGMTAVELAEAIGAHQALSLLEEYTND